MILPRYGDIVFTQLNHTAKKMVFVRYWSNILNCIYDTVQTCVSVGMILFLNQTLYFREDLV